ncbi:MAG: ATP-binding protein [Clostridiales bacterium]|nr:ATP-binding protein [Clostridiales bacterium]
MKDLSLHILDIAQNSIHAGAKLVEITIKESETRLTLTVRDDGCGMDAELLVQAQSPFGTTRTTRKVGLGLPLLRQAAEQADGAFSVESVPGAGTSVYASYDTGHIDALPLGDLAETVVTLLQGSPDLDFAFIHSWDTPTACEAALDTREMREMLGEIPLDTPEVLLWAKEALTEQYNLR